MFPKLVKFTIEERKTDWVMWIELDETGKWIIQKWTTDRAPKMSGEYGNCKHCGRKL